MSIHRESAAQKTGTPMSKACASGRVNMRVNSGDSLRVKSLVSLA